jgi:hypothetical protein
MAIDSSRTRNGIMLHKGNGEGIGETHMAPQITRFYSIRVIRVIRG